MFNKNKEWIGTYSLWSEIIFQVPQGSILGLLILNVFLCDISQLPPDLDIANDTNDNTLLSSKLNLNEVWHDLEKRIKHFVLRLTENLLRQTWKNHIFLRAKHKRFKLTLLKWPTAIANVKKFWVSILIISWYLSPT